jgi:2-polyprenyl-3-methyl-5-hydroxy-6-metoxy-1,4-benzoquinol methylase
MTTIYFRCEIILKFLKKKYKHLKNKKVYINSTKYKTFTDSIFQKAIYSYDENVEYAILAEKDKKKYKNTIDLIKYFELLDLDICNAREVFKSLNPIPIIELKTLKKIFKKIIKENKKILYLHPKNGEYNLLLLVLMRLYSKSSIFIKGDINPSYKKYINLVFKNEIKQSKNYDVIISEKKLNIKGYNEFYFYLYFYMKEKNGDCPVCGSKSELFFIKKNSHKWYECKMCKHKFVKNANKKQLEEFYKNYKEIREKVTPILEKRINEMSMFINFNKINSILEIGAGYGEILEEFKKQNKNVAAVEIDKEAIKILKQKNIEVYDDLSKINRQFDLIYSYHTFEHIQDINKTYKLIYKLLKPNGILLTHIPCEEIDYYIPDHLHIFSLKSITIFHKKFFNNYNYLIRSKITSANIYAPLITIISKKVKNEN